MKGGSAIRSGLTSCHCCQLLVRLPAALPHSRARCPRCGSPVHPRKPDSLARTWALVIAVLILALDWALRRRSGYL